MTNLFMPHFTCLYDKSNDRHIVKGIFVPVVMLAWLMALKCYEWFWWKDVSKCIAAVVCNAVTWYLELESVKGEVPSGVTSFPV